MDNPFNSMLCRYVDREVNRQRDSYYTVDRCMPFGGTMVWG
jgi:hypothetical protein